MDCSTLGFPVHHQLLEPTQTHVHWVCDAIQPSHPLSSPGVLQSTGSQKVRHNWATEWQQQSLDKGEEEYKEEEAEEKPMIFFLCEY